MKRRKGFYSISTVAQMCNVHQQTIRLYEKEGLITPHRTEGGTRLFTEEDVDRLEEIINLTQKMGVNLAGVEMILRLQRKIKKMQDDMNKLFETTQTQLADETTSLRAQAHKTAQALVDLKKKKTTPALPNTKKPSSEEAATPEEWKVEYDE